MNESKEYIKLCEFAGVTSKPNKSGAFYLGLPIYPPFTEKKAWQLLKLAIKREGRLEYLYEYPKGKPLCHCTVGFSGYCSKSKGNINEEQALCSLIPLINWNEEEMKQIKKIIQGL